MKKYFFLSLAFLSCSFLNAQQSFDSSFPYDSDPAKKFSLYVPSSYVAGTPNKMMLAFHPFNTTRWDAISWRNELTSFAEDAGLILVCPDGGTDGRVDDPLDYGFTTVLLDSVKKWYAIDEDKIFAMGFSVGGKATYEYGLNNASVFAGFIPIGAAINGTTEVNSVLSNALCKPFYLIHGENDAPSVRYTPIKAALEQNKAEVNTIFMAGIGHTIDFPNRNSILSNAFNWIDTVSCKTSTGISPVNVTPPFRVFPSMVSSDGSLFLGINLKSTEVLTIEVWSMDGKLVHSERDSFQITDHPISVRSLSKGAYTLIVRSEISSFSQKFIVQ